MLIRFFKENDVIGYGGDPQTIRLQECIGVHIGVSVGIRIGVRIGVHVGVHVGVHMRTIYEHEPACVILTLFNIL